MQLHIITLNFNGSENTIKLLESLHKQTDKDFRTIVIDNASEEADFNTLQLFINNINNENWPTCDVGQLIRNSQNLGFSGGNNVGIKKALEIGILREASGQANWVVLLNNDTWVENDFIARLKPILSQKEGIVGLPLSEDGQTTYCGKIEWLKPTLSHQLSTVNCQPSTVYAIGGAMAIHKNVFNKIGFLDEKYFLYFEDADFSVRAKKANIPISIMPEILVYHNPSSSTKKLGSPLLLRYHYRNALYFNLKNGPWYIKLLVWPWSWWIVAKQILKVVIYHNREQSKAILNGVFDFYRDRMGKINTGTNTGSL